MNSSAPAARSQSDPVEPQNAHSLRAGALVALDQLVNLEHVDLTALQALKALTDMLKQHAELLSVVLADDLARLAPARAVRSEDRRGDQRS